MDKTAFIAGFMTRWYLLKSADGRKRLRSRYPVWVDHSSEALAEAGYLDNRDPGARYISPTNKPPSMSLVREDPQWIYDEGVARPGPGQLKPGGNSFWMGPDQKWVGKEYSQDLALNAARQKRGLAPMKIMPDKGMAPSDFTTGPAPALPPGLPPPSGR